MSGCIHICKEFSELKPPCVNASDRFATLSSNVPSQPGAPSLRLCTENIFSICHTCAFRQSRTVPLHSNGSDTMMRLRFAADPHDDEDLSVRLHKVLVYRFPRFGGTLAVHQVSRLVPSFQILGPTMHHTHHLSGTPGEVRIGKYTRFIISHTGAAMTYIIHTVLLHYHHNLHLPASSRPRT